MRVNTASNAADELSRNDSMDETVFGEKIDIDLDGIAQHVFFSVGMCVNNHICSRAAWERGAQLQQVITCVSIAPQSSLRGGRLRPVDDL